MRQAGLEPLAGAAEQGMIGGMALAAPASLWCWAFLALVATVVAPSAGTAGVDGRDELVHQAEAIAVIEVLNARQVVAPNGYYSRVEYLTLQYVDARVVELLKGSLPAEPRIITAGSDYPIRLPERKKGERLLVFLCRRGTHWMTLGNWFYVFPVSPEGTVDWLTSPHGTDRAKRALADVCAGIRKLVRSKDRPQKSPGTTRQANRP